MSNFDDEYKVSTIDNQRKINHKKIKKNNRDSKVTKEKKDRATKTKEDSSENTTGKSHRKNLAMNNEWLTNVLLN